MIQNFFDINETDQNKLLNCLGDIKYKINYKINSSNRVKTSVYRGILT